MGETHWNNMTILRSLLLTALMALVVAAKTNLADDVVPEGQFYDQQEVAAGEEPVSEESVPDFIRSSKAAATATEGFLQDTEDPAGYTQAGHCYTMRIGFKPWNGMEMASHFQTAYAQSLITGYKKGGDVAQSTAYLTSKCQERCDASNDCTGFYYELSQYWVDRANDGGDDTGSALGDCQLFYQHSDTCVTDCLASPYFAKALEARGSDYETGMVTWLHTTWADQCQAYCGKPPAGRSDLQGKSHWSIKHNRNGYPTCTDPVGDCAPEIARYKADSSMCGTWTWGGMGFSYKKSMTPPPPPPPPPPPTAPPTLACDCSACHWGFGNYNHPIYHTYVNKGTHCEVMWGHHRPACPPERANPFSGSGGAYVQDCGAGGTAHNGCCNRQCCGGTGPKPPQ